MSTLLTLSVSTETSIMMLPLPLSPPAQGAPAVSTPPAPGASEAVMALAALVNQLQPDDVVDADVVVVGGVAVVVVSCCVRLMFLQTVTPPLWAAVRAAS